MKHLLLCSLFGVILCGCEKNQDVQSDTFSIADVAIENNEMPTRAAIWGTQFSHGSEIGVTLVETETGEVVSPNSNWTVSGSTWSSPIKVNLDANNHTAYAYYPYNNSITDLESAPIAYNQRDYMWGRSSSTAISSASGKNVVSFSMHRVMTRIAVFIRKEITYKGPGVLTYICLRNAPRKQVLITDASLLRWNVKTGALSSTALPEAGSSLKMYYADSEISYPVALPTVIGSESVADIICAPVQTFQDGDIEINMVVDGIEYMIPIPSPTGTGFAEAEGGWKAGYNYRYALTITPNHVTLSAITINDWIEITDPPIVVN